MGWTLLLVCLWSLKLQEWVNAYKPSSMTWGYEYNFLQDKSQKYIGNVSVSLGSSECSLCFKYRRYSPRIPSIGGSGSQPADISSSQVVAVSGWPLISPWHLAPQGMAAGPHAAFLLPRQGPRWRNGKDGNLLAGSLFQSRGLFEYHTTGKQALLHNL